MCSTPRAARPSRTAPRRPERRPHERDILIGVDAGTSVIKSIAFDLDGRQIAVAATPNRYQTRPTARRSEQDMARTWEDCAATLRGLAERVPDLADAHGRGRA